MPSVFWRSTSNLLEVSTDQDGNEQNFFRKWGNIVYKYRIKVSICCPLVTLGIIGVLALFVFMTIYLPNKTQRVTNIQLTSTSYYLVYGTNTKLNHAMNISDMKNVANNLMKSIDLPNIVVVNVKLIPSLVTSGAQKRQALIDDIYCQKDPGTNGDLLVMTISIDYPGGCTDVDCRKTFDDKIQHSIDTLHTKISFEIMFADGQKLQMQMSFCSLQRISSGSCWPQCSNGATCSSEGICLCRTGWNGSDCTIPTCSRCLNNGSCSAPNQCSCMTGWTGSDCSIPICLPSCQNNGSCISPGVCKCTSNWMDSDCTTPICSIPCSNGFCSNPEVCNCTAGWEGVSCQKPICSKPCLNNGTCSSPNVCTCASGWNGPDCSTPVCANGCLNNGTCSSPNACTCASGWNGPDCANPICTSPCLNNGSCAAPNKCSCMSGWSGSDCSIPVCFSLCQNDGSCISPGVCNCTSGWTDSHCTTPVCSTPCSNGICSSPGVCTCTTGWKGPDCKTAICSEGCLNNGICVSPEVCSCPTGWKQPNCATAICLPECSNNGICQSPGVCQCTADWSGSDCKTPVCKALCRNGAVCTSPGVCSCPSGWTGATCEIPICTTSCLNGGVCQSPDVCSCSSGWTGSNCKSPICSPVCSNGGTCSSSRTCICPTGWKGNDCTQPVCNQGCKNGGVCVTPGGCVCPRGWTGPDCGKQAGGGCYYGKDKINLIEGGQRYIEKLKVGDRVWSLNIDENSFIEDEIILMMHNEPYQSDMFYTIETIDGNEISLTKTHNIPIYDPKTNQIKFLRASKVTIKHHLIVFNRKVAIKNITTASRLGFFSPLTMSGSLFVNNISTSVFSDSYGVSPNTLQRFFTPIRIYYRFMKWYFGNDYNPFETHSEEGLHPIIQCLKQNTLMFKFIYYGLQNIVLLMIFYMVYKYYPTNISVPFYKTFMRSDNV